MPFSVSGPTVDRERRGAARKLLAHGIDPSAAKRAEKATQADTFEAVAREWLGKHAPRWNPAHAGEIRRPLVRDIFPALGPSTRRVYRALHQTT